MNLSDTLVYNQANNIYFSTRDTIFISSLTEDYIYIVLVISAFEVYNKKHKSVFNKKHYRAPIIQPITDPLFSQPIILLISKYVLRPCANPVPREPSHGLTKQNQNVNKRIVNNSNVCVLIN